jgi:hypothetical protein
MIMEFENFADQAMRGLEEDGYEYISDHPCLAGHWLRRESKGWALNPHCPDDPVI